MTAPRIVPVTIAASRPATMPITATRATPHIELLGGTECTSHAAAASMSSAFINSSFA